MPNKVFIKPLFTSNMETKKTKKGKDVKETVSLAGLGGNEVMVFPLKEDITFVTSSEISSWSDMIPGLDLLTKVQSLSTGASGTVNTGILDLQNMLDAPRWQKTNPIEFTIQLSFYTVDDPYEDVYLPMKKLIGLSVLSYNKDTKRVIPPGIFLPAKAATKKNAKGSDLQNTAKLIAIKIPGIITMNVAIIKACVPIFSKHVTESNYPLWGTLEITVAGLYPAFENDFNADLGVKFGE